MYFNTASLISVSRNFRDSHQKTELSLGAQHTRHKLGPMWTDEWHCETEIPQRNALKCLSKIAISRSDNLVYGSGVRTLMWMYSLEKKKTIQVPTEMFVLFFIFVYWIFLYFIFGLGSGSKHMFIYIDIKNIAHMYWTVCVCQESVFGQLKKWTVNCDCELHFLSAWKRRAKWICKSKLKCVCAWEW